MSYGVYKVTPEIGQYVSCNLSRSPSIIKLNIIEVLNRGYTNCGQQVLICAYRQTDGQMHGRSVFIHVSTSYAGGTKILDIIINIFIQQNMNYHDIHKQDL